MRSVKYVFLSVFALSAALLLFFSQPTLSGNFSVPIGSSSLITALIAIAVVGMLVIAGLEQRVLRRDARIISAQEFTNRVLSKAGPSDRAIVLDTSAVLDYSPSEVETMLKSYGVVYVPQGVLGEIRTPELHRIVQRYGTIIPFDSKDRALARTCLEESEKYQLSKFLLPYLKDRTLASRDKSPRRLLQEINDKTGRVRGIMAREGILDVAGAKENTARSFGLVTAYLEKTCALSEIDIDVLATALHKSMCDKQKTFIGEKDSDFEDAVKAFKRKYPQYQLECVNPYRQAS